MTTTATSENFCLQGPGHQLIKEGSKGGLSSFENMAPTRILVFHMKELPLLSQDAEESTSSSLFLSLDHGVLFVDMQWNLNSSPCPTVGAHGMERKHSISSSAQQNRNYRHNHFVFRSQRRRKLSNLFRHVATVAENDSDPQVERHAHGTVSISSYLGVHHDNSASAGISKS